MFHPCCFPVIACHHKTQIDAKWHFNYHLLRCWLEAEATSSPSPQAAAAEDNTSSRLRLLQQLLQHGSDAADARAGAVGGGLDLSWLLEDSFDSTVAGQQQRHNHQLPQQQEQQQEEQQEQQQQLALQQQQQLPPEMHEAAVWLQRQVELYGKLKLTPLKVQLLRKLGEWAQRALVRLLRCVVLCGCLKRVVGYISSSSRTRGVECVHVSLPKQRSAQNSNSAVPLALLDHMSTFCTPWVCIPLQVFVSDGRLA